MAKIIENFNGRRSIRLSIDDIICIVREYQNTIRCEKDYDLIRKMLSKCDFYIPEDV